ncbi:MAG: transcriptional regulator [Chloroflexi bacterium]|nr:transcriptional regulator [Chloroflexota bacterium]
MSDELNITPQDRADFGAARLKAFFRDILAFLRGQRNDLLSYNDMREKLKIGGPIYRGVKTVLVSQIAGSVNRYRDFDRAFLPTQTHTAERWQKINRAFYQDVSLPPVLLYKVGDVYFVLDGNHRVSVAREKGQEFIEAEVRECSVRVPITPDLQPDDLEILGEKVAFLERTGFDKLKPGADIALTILGGYERLLEHIAVHKYYMGLEFQRDISDDEAVVHWYDTVCLPLINAIRQAEVLDRFPARTEADLYLWVIDHQHYLREHEPEITPQDAAQDYAEKFGE